MRTTHDAASLAKAGPYSHAAEIDGFVFLSGQTPFDPATGRLIESGLGDQTRQCFANLAAVLATAGLTQDDVVKVNVFLTDMNDFATMNEVYAAWFHAPYPARTTVGVIALPLGAHVEIEFVARRGTV